MSESSFILTFVLGLCVIVAFSDSSSETVRIVNSGSSNTAGYTIDLQEDGTVSWTVADRPHSILSTTAPSPTNMTSQISIALTNAVFRSVKQASPLNQFPIHFCIKSVSFGTMLHVIYHGEQSPDLNCPLEDARLVALNKAVREVISLLHINTFG